MGSFQMDAHQPKTRSLRWSPEEDALLIQMSFENRSIFAIAKVLARSELSIRSRASKLSIRFRRPMRLKGRTR
jgi:hypothetical protein